MAVPKVPATFHSVFIEPRVTPNPAAHAPKPVATASSLGHGAKGDQITEEALQKALQLGVDSGRLTAQCSSCRWPLQSPEHAAGKCPRCGELGKTPAHPFVQYYLPN